MNTTLERWRQFAAQRLLKRKKSIFAPFKAIIIIIIIIIIIKTVEENKVLSLVQETIKDLLSASSTEMEMLPAFDEQDDHTEDIEEVSGIEKKDCQVPHLLQPLALEMIDDQYIVH